MRTGSKVEPVKSPKTAAASAPSGPSGTTITTGTIPRVNSKTDRHTLLASIKRAAQAGTAGKMFESGKSSFHDAQKSLGNRRKTASHIRATSDLVMPHGTNKT